MNEINNTIKLQPVQQKRSRFSIDKKRYNYKQPIRVDSPAPLSDGLMGSKWIYIPALLCFGFPALLYYFTRIFVAEHGADMLRKKVRFWMPDVKFTPTELFTQIAGPLTAQGMQVDINDKGNIRVTHNHTIFDVNFYEDNTYGLWWRKSVTRAFLPTSQSTIYKKAVVSMGLIAYTIQTTLEKMAAENSK